MKKGSEVDRTAIRSQNQSSQSSALLKLALLATIDINLDAITFPTIQLDLGSRVAL
jgi:hypothetical protein